MPMYSSLAQAPSPPPIAAVKDYLDAHNETRSVVGVGPLWWSEALAKSASLTVRILRDKQNCSFADLSKSRFGGNQLWDSGMKVPPRAVVENWVAEKNFYDYGTNTCAAEHRCGVYTQVVWRKSEELGWAQVSCAKEQSVLTIYFDNLPGNVVGEKPY